MRPRRGVFHLRISIVLSPRSTSEAHGCLIERAYSGASDTPIPPFLQCTVIQESADFGKNLLPGDLRVPIARATVPLEFVRNRARPQIRTCGSTPVSDSEQPCRGPSPSVAAS